MFRFVVHLFLPYALKMLKVSCPNFSTICLKFNKMNVYANSEITVQQVTQYTKKGENDMLFELGILLFLQKSIIDIY